jgi:hypothetical protein
MRTSYLVPRKRKKKVAQSSFSMKRKERKKRKKERKGRKESKIESET